MSKPDFDQVVEQGRALQERFPELQLIAVGGTAAALHCQHRISLDVDEVTPLLQGRYAEITEALRAWPGWTTNRLNPPVLILGEREGVQLGLRQQRRATPLRITKVSGLVIPTAKEMLRVKAFLLIERRATRDYVDVAALMEHLGTDAAVEALAYLNALYPNPGAQTLITRFAEASETEPLDLATVPLPEYRGLKPPLTDWRHVRNVCQQLGRAVLKCEMDGAMNKSLDAAFESETN